jgi:radical SAM/Cys-rich protein
VDQTLDALEDNSEFQATAKRYVEMGAEKISREERAMRRRALDDLGINPFNSFLKENGIPKLERKAPTVLQINIGLLCNQACDHCHVESSPLKTAEQMTAETAAQCLKLLVETPSITTLDITGGAPELNENFRFLVQMARNLRPEIEIIDRCNLTVLQEPGQEDLIDFLQENRVRIVASLPCYSAENVDQQRGNGVFERSIAALLALGEAGYGIPGSDLTLDLVYNPLGAFLPPEQEQLEVQYKEVLEENFGILFNSLFTMTNMPIKRFADFLHRRGELKGYMDLLVRNFNKDTTERLMCLDTVNVGWDGHVYDCDFNQQLGYEVGVDSIHRGGLTVFDMDSFDLSDKPIRRDNHCFGCTAGMGSS